MASIQRNWFLAGGALAALMAAFPAQAEEASTQSMTMAESTSAVAAQVESDTTEAAIEISGFEMSNFLGEDTLVEGTAASAEDAVQADIVVEPEQLANQTLDDYLAESEPVIIDDTFTSSADAFIADAEVAQTTESLPAEQEVAQVTRPLYRGVSPFYIGVGGNIGIIDSGKSATGDFGFNIISKISLGPRFAVRPTMQFSEDEWNITLPITFNFNPVELGRFSFYPSVGGGVDFGDDLGLLVNGGIDVPISRDFTLNGQVNWRVTEDPGLGVSLGVGYNFPIFFE